jgi:hypothetical protein
MYSRLYKEATQGTQGTLKNKVSFVEADLEKVLK